MKRPFFAVLGGMGTLATESYIRLVNRATHAHCDQDYLDYIVFNDSSVPDRTAYILGESDENPSRTRRRYREGNGDGREFHCAHLQYRALFL